MKKYRIRPGSAYHGSFINPAVYQDAEGFFYLKMKSGLRFYINEHDVEEAPAQFELFDEVEGTGDLNADMLGFVVEVTDNNVIVYWPENLEANQYDHRFAPDLLKKTGKKVATPTSTDLKLKQSQL